jgi:signal peptidase I
VPRIAGDPAFAERFTREARAMALLSHPHIVTVHDFGQTTLRRPSSGEGPLYYFLMEYVDGLNLRQLLDANQLSPAEAMAIVPQICDALQYAHDAGVVHRDIKPENILLDRKGEVKIADFGLAKLVGRPSQGPAEHLTGEGQVMGTPHYMAPEQTEHPQTVDHRADIYSLGVVFYQMLTGELPLGRFAPPSKKVHIDVRLDEIVLRALEKEPELRFQQASHLKTEIETIAAAPAANKPALPTKPRPWWKRWWAQVLVAVVVAVLLRTFVLQAYFVAGSSAEPELPRGSLILAWKRTRDFIPGDMVVYDSDGKALVGRIVSTAHDSITVNRNRQPDARILRHRVIGRVMSVLWRGAAGDPSEKPRTTEPRLSARGQAPPKPPVQIAGKTPPVARVTADQVIVEDLALQILVAIRERDDAVLKSLAVDRIKGWRDALPQFALELRERLRQKTGKPFDLRQAETLVSGDLAVVKCTGPTELQGSYLVLLFVKPADGWRNWSLRNSPALTPLGEYLKQKPPQA